MNYTMIPAKTCCNKCNNIQDIGAEHCSACGISFVFGKDDAWTSKPFNDYTKKNIDCKVYNNSRVYESIPCLLDNVEPGTPIMLSCPCPRCSPSC